MNARPEASQEPEISHAVTAWFERRSYHHERFVDVDALVRAKDARGLTVTLVFPARNVAETIGSVLRVVQQLNEDHPLLVDQVVVVDADSVDGTAQIAADAGACVFSENALMSEYGAALGKGDAMWRSLSVAWGDVVMFADSDTAQFGPHFIVGVLGVILTEPGVGFVKAGYRRPFAIEGLRSPYGGGRVTELLARPLLNLLYPHLAGFVQPLAGEFAARRDLLCSIPFFTGYGAEAGILVDMFDRLGLDALAQVDLGVRLNRHQDLADLGRMSYSVLRAVLHRASAREPGLYRASPRLSETMLTYLHAVSGTSGFQLHEYVEELVERPPMRVALSQR